MIAWTNPQSGLVTSIKENGDGDAIMRQGKTGLFVHYDYWPHLLLHGIFFCLQSGIQVPNQFNLSMRPIGLNNTKGEPVVLLQSAHYRSRQGKRITIPLDTEENSLELQVSSDSGFDYSPKISGKDLVYIGQDSRKVLTFTQSEMHQFFEGVSEPMMRNVRGTRPRMEAVYSEFPWEFYKQLSNPSFPNSQ